MKITFSEKNHTYTVDGELAHISVTELLHKHGLAPDLDKVDKAVVKAKAAKGKEIHKDLENVLNKPKYEPTTVQGEFFEKWARENLDCGVGEQVLGYDLNGMKFGGTADVIGFAKNGEMIVGDHKTTAKFEREYVSWQVSLLDYFARSLNGQLLNGKPFHWKGATKFYCFWYTKDGELQVKELEKVPDEEIVKLLMAEYKGDKYQRPQLVIEGELQAEFEQAELQLVELGRSYKSAKATVEELRAKLKDEMERQGIRSFQTDKVRLTYIPQNDRYTVDSTKLKRLYPQVYGECVKLTKVAPSLRITIKGETDDEQTFN